ncbi:MAG: hypothetical protein KatS3mg014_2505 [Actinomycetota bacterium]|nr:MAG: hypothetical protein KatS3mg014_2500 [Actinomycetota bacterium]GIV00890.1 MAG: hypothetical protein KatS3mg014_2505 [Actinomycetota bacterium]
MTYTIDPEAMPTHQWWCRSVRPDDADTRRGCTCGAPAVPGAILDGSRLGVPDYIPLARATDALPDRWRRIIAADLGGRAARRQRALVDRAVARLAAQAARHGMSLAVHWGGLGSHLHPYDPTFRRLSVLVWLLWDRQVVGEVVVAVHAGGLVEWRRADAAGWRPWHRADVVLRRSLTPATPRRLESRRTHKEAPCAMQ